MPRSNWKGFISFGLVNIPIVLFNSIDPSSNVSFKQINSKTGNKIQYKRVDSETGKEVPWDEIEKGYEYDKDVILPVDNNELKRVAGENSRTIAIEEFVNKDSIDFVNLESTYYLVPDKKGAKGYVILREALRKSNKIGIAKVIISTKEYLAAIAVKKNALVLYLLHYQDEIRNLDDFDIPNDDLKKNKITAKEVDVAVKLVNSMSGKWQPNKYKDEYKLAVQHWVEAKIKHLPESPMKQRASLSSSAKVVDFVDLLKKSLATEAKGKKRSVKATKKQPPLPQKRVNHRTPATKH